MSYNTRRNPNYVAPSAASVGQRRPQQQQPIGNSFVAGGQLNQQNKPQPVQQQTQQQRVQQQQQQPQQQQGNVVRQQQIHQQQQHNMRQQAQDYLNQQVQSQDIQKQPQQQQQPPQQQQQQPQQQQPQQQQQQQQQQPAKLAESNGTQDDDGIEVDEEGKPKKKFWANRTSGGKITKKERLRRRNQRLRKILQPKNALTVLHELVGSPVYSVIEAKDENDAGVFKCTVLVDGVEHLGAGNSKPLAKNSAADSVLKHLVLSKLKEIHAQQRNPANQAAENIAEKADDPNKMEVEGEDNVGGISWSHIACYAIHKLLNSWDEGAGLEEKLVQSTSTSSIVSDKVVEKKPAKKLPANADTMNPLMVLNQMIPNAVYEEVSRTGNAPNFLFTIQLTIGTDVFTGKAAKKKEARKMCAFAACRKLLDIVYAPEFLEEHGFNEDAVSYIPGIKTE